jgi:hypothetical protein
VDDERTLAGEYIRALLNGSPPNGTPPEAFTVYRDIIEGVVLVHSYGGTP